MKDKRYFDTYYNYDHYYELQQSRYYKNELFQYLNHYQPFVGQIEFGSGNIYIMKDYLSRMIQPHYKESLNMIMDYCDYTKMKFPQELTQTKQFKQYRLEQRLEQINDDFN